MKERDGFLERLNGNEIFLKPHAAQSKLEFLCTELIMNSRVFRVCEAVQIGIFLPERLCYYRGNSCEQRFVSRITMIMIVVN